MHVRFLILVGLLVFLAVPMLATRAAADAGPGYGGHTFLEAYYGGKWHTFDTMTSFCVMNREEKPVIASLEELKADPTLVTKAEEEKRTVGGFLTCRHKPALHYRNLDIVRKMGWKRDLRWATLAFGTGGKPGDLITFWTEGPKKWKAIGKEGSTYGGHYRPFCEFELHITGAGAAAVKRVKTIYQLNMYALPSLRPGKNTVRVSAKTKKPAGSKLVVHYEWNDGDGWKHARKVTREFTTLPGKFEVEVAGEKMPRMRKLELRVEPVKK